MMDVEITINTFERNIDLVTSPGYLTSAVTQHHFPFALRTLLVNNVSDRPAAARKATAAIDRGEVDRFMFVDDLLSRGLALTGLRESDFGRYLHWSDCCLAALAASGPKLLCYADVDLALETPVDWISPALEVMGGDPRVVVANPTWITADGSSSVASEADEYMELGWLGYGFSDQVFLIHRSDFARPLRRRPRRPLWLESPASLRYPGGDGNLFFEQIADAYMRSNRLMRATISTARFIPVPFNVYPANGLVERILRRRDFLILDILDRLRTRWPDAVSDPRLRVTGLLDRRSPPLE